MYSIAVNETGAIYLTGDDPHTTVTGRRSLVLQRLPAR